MRQRSIDEEIYLGGGEADDGGNHELHDPLQPCIFEIKKKETKALAPELRYLDGELQHAADQCSDGHADNRLAA